MAAAVEHCKLWEKSGRAELLKLCRHQPESNLQLGNVSKVIKKSFYEVCWQVIRGNVKLETAVQALGEVCDYVKDASPHLADVFALIDLECQAQDDKELRDKLVDIISACENSVATAVLKERLDQELLESVGLIPSKLAFQQKYVKTKTKLYYKQQKFNLLREESEGYAKLITELNQEVNESIPTSQSVQNLKSLIGCFDLDPNRVIDILLESFECRPHLCSFYVPLFEEYVTDKTTLCQILGFKFHFYQEEETPDSLYKIAAILLKNSLVELDLLYPHLSPTDDKVKEYHQKEVDEAKSYARKLNVVSLADKTEDPKDTENVKVDLYLTNQKIGLCEALLILGAWTNAKDILDRLPEFFAVVHRPIASAMCSLVHYLIEPLYRENTFVPKRILKGKLANRNKYEGEIPKVSSYRDLHNEVLPIMRYLGPYTACDPVLLVKIIRLGKSFMNKRQTGGLKAEEDVAYYGFLNMLDEVLLPSMGLLPCNCCISEDLWGLLRMYPYELRYRLYGNWKNDTYSHHPKLIRIRADCLERARYLMKRLSKENVKPSGRQLGKLSHSNPGVLFEYTLSQIQRYDNFIGPVVDTLKYLTSLSYDILAFCIIEAVANPEKDRMKHDDTNISLWLQSLANFAGSICRKYQVELAGLMQYVANQLKACKSYDLLLLREIVTKMAGIEISEEITNDQLEAMTGGELLRQEGGYFAQVRNTKKASTRLKETLLEHNLALPLCLLMAQQRDGVIYQEGAESHLKLVGKLYDQCQDTLVQFGSFLSMQLSTEEFVKRLPSIDTLMSQYHIPADAAFFLCRPQYAYAISSRFEELRKIDKSNKQGGSQMKLQRFLEASEEVMQPVIEQIRPLYTPRVWEDLSPQFYVTFWSLQMYDLCVPTSVYEKQIQQLQAQAAAVEENKDLTQGKRKKEKERCTNLMDKLKEEMKKQNDHCNRVMHRLKNQKELWFISRSTKNETITQFLQLCVFPRCCFTAADAIFCAKFIHILHDLKTPNFSTLICCDRIFCDITYTVTSCTENEAHRYGRFLCAALDTIMRWHSNKDIYDKECGSYPGFVTVFRKGIDNQAQHKADQLDYENYRHVCHKWHFRITKAMVACLESGNYIQIRNALIVLTKILPNYPKITQFGQALERRVDRLRQEEKEKRPDIYALAMGYSGQLKAKKSSWVQEHQFHLKEAKAAATKSASATTVQNGPTSATTAGAMATTPGMADPGTSQPSTTTSVKKSSSDTKKFDGESKSKEKKDKDKKSSEKKEKSKSDKKGADGDNGSKSKEKKEKRDREEKSKDRGRTEDKITSDKGQGDEKASKDRESSKDKESSKSKEKKEKESRDGEEMKIIKIKKEKDEPEDKSHSEGKRQKASDEVNDRDVGLDRREIKTEKNWDHEGKEERRSDREKEVKMKEEKQERDGRSKEERHEKIKIKRGFSPERDGTDREHGRDHRDRETTEKAESSESRGSHHRRSPEPSTSKHNDEREVKRRKLEEQASGSKERDRSVSKERHRKSPSHERERKDRKRMSVDYEERNDVDVKRRRSAEPPSSHSHTYSSSINGDAERRHSKKDGDRGSRAEDRTPSRTESSRTEERTPARAEGSRTEDKTPSRDKTTKDGTESVESSPRQKSKEHREKDKTRNKEKKDKSSSKKSKK